MCSNNLRIWERSHYYLENNVLRHSGLKASNSVIDSFICVDHHTDGFIKDAKYLARSSFSVVYKQYSYRYGCDVAIKIADRKKAAKFLRREIEVCRFVYHPFLCYTFTVLEPSPTRVLFISEYYSQGTLLSLLLSRRRLQEPLSAILFRQLSEGLQYLHSLLIAHRDLKLENVFICKYGNVKIGDFGFARRMISRRHRAKTICGTKPYSCPDLLRKRKYDPFASDWYSMGIMLYTIISGVWPYNFDVIDEPWNKINYWSQCFSTEAVNLLTQMLTENSELRADYNVCMDSEFMLKYQQSHAYHPVVFGTYNSLFN